MGSNLLGTEGDERKQKGIFGKCSYWPETHQSMTYPKGDKALAEEIEGNAATGSAVRRTLSKVWIIQGIYAIRPCGR